MNLAKKIQRARAVLRETHRPLILTGAGISVASGLPTFRGPGGLWNRRNLLKYACAEILDEDPVGAWQAYEAMRLLVDAQKPNPAHHALHVWLQNRPQGKLFTQNVDGYHAAAGDQALEMHGNIHRLRCRACNYAKQSVAGQLNLHPACPECGAWLRHDVVLFGEPVKHADEFLSMLESCDLVVLIGTSGWVTDTQAIARDARRRRLPVMEIDPALFTRASWWTTHRFREKAEYLLPELVAF